MKYLIIGTGGTGGCIGGYMADSGKDVTFIARNAHLKAMRENGFKVHDSRKGEIHIENVKAYEEREYEEKADVIFVCVKSYSVQDIIPLIKKASHSKTVIIPILNVFGIGDKLAKEVPELCVLDGCIYISAYISAPGEVTQAGNIFKVVYGVRENTDVDKDILYAISVDLEESGIKAIISDNIKRDTFKKFSFISSYASTGAYYDVLAKEMQKEGKERETFIALNNELKKIAKHLNFEFDSDILEDNLKILDGLTPDTTASMQKDMKAGKSDERQEIIFDVVKIAEKCDISVPSYKTIADFFQIL